MLGKAGLLDTKFGLILVYSGLNASLVVWMMESYLAETPPEIEEAALVDGDTPLSALRRIVLPLAAPGLVATAIFSVIVTYNEFLLALSFTSTPTHRRSPWASARSSARSRSSGGHGRGRGQWRGPDHRVRAQVQRHFVRGLTLGALK